MVNWGKKIKNSTDGVHIYKDLESMMIEQEGEDTAMSRPRRLGIGCKSTGLGSLFGQGK